MTQIVLVSLLTFFLGCVFTEFRWIARMRRLRGKLNLAEAAREYAGESAKPCAAEVASVLSSDMPDSPAPASWMLDNLRESLINLQQTLAAETASVRVAETPEISKS